MPRTNLTAGDGPRTFYAFAREGLNNTAVQSRTVPLDTVPFTGTLVLDKGAAVTYHWWVNVEVQPIPAGGLSSVCMGTTPNYTLCEDASGGYYTNSYEDYDDGFIYILPNVTSGTTVTVYAW